MKYERKYLGITITASNYRSILSTQGRFGINFHAKHLKAYLRGDDRFAYGWRRDEDGRAIDPIYHKVKQSLKLIK